MFEAIANFLVDYYIGSKQIQQDAYESKFDITDRVISSNKFDKFCRTLFDFIKIRVKVNVRKGLLAVKYDAKIPNSKLKTIDEKVQEWQSRKKKLLLDAIESNRAYIENVAKGGGTAREIQQRLALQRPLFPGA